jgi:phosphoribosyl-ATP pyrophosphohydrolase/phosphoribosyl-AMP cyclohydrolase
LNASEANYMKIDFEKLNGLVPVVIQDGISLEVLMLGFMNEEAYAKTLAENKVCFYSRTKKRLWTKGEESGNFLNVLSIHHDCDQDTLLIKVKPVGATCHTGARSCFQTSYNQNFIFKLEEIVQQRYDTPLETSYINSLRKKGLNKIAQKVGEEGVETVIAALAETDELLVNEAADLLFHLTVLLREKNLSLANVASCLENRHDKK